MPRQYSPPVRIPVVVSAAFTTSSNSGNLRTLNSASTFNPIALCDAVTLILDVTAHTIAGGPAQLRVYIDGSPDGGTTWYPQANFGLVSTSADIQRLEFRPIGIGPTEAAALVRIGTTIITTSASTSSTVLSPDHRVRWEFASTATTPSATFAIWALCADAGTYGA